MPALVNRRVGSSLGMSGELFTTRWLCCSKYRKNALRISLLVMCTPHVLSPPLCWGEGIYHIAKLASCSCPQLAQRALQPEGDLAAPIRASAYDSRQEVQLRFVRLFGTYLPTHIEQAVR